MRIPWKHDETGWTAQSDVTALRAWENGTAELDDVILALCRHNDFGPEIFEGVPAEEIEEEFRKLGYLREEERRDEHDGNS